ncbi:MAG TPA: hypothetical protein VMO47_16850 [Rhodothermales bacterium]|nr:hypothetical protein [Rhodothermales bacterium]
MHRFVRDINRATAALLLAVFVVGGILAPSVHRAVHSVEYAVVSMEAAHACDHSSHADAYENDRPDPLDEDCLLCVRQAMSVNAPHLLHVGYQDSGDYQFRERTAPDKLHLSFSPIRGPPHAA